MKEFLKMFFAALLAGVVFMIAPFFLFMGLIAGLGALAGGDDMVVVPENASLVINTSTPVMDCVVEDPMSQFSAVSILSGGGSSATPVALKDLTDAISRAKDDERIKGIVLTGEYWGGGTAQMIAVRKALEDFKTSGKYIVTYSNIHSQGDYILKSVGKVFLNPNGAVDFSGLSMTNIFFKGFLDKYGIETQVFRTGKFKSAVEPYLTDKMSPENRAQSQRMIDSMWDTISVAVAKSRGLTHEALCQAAASRVGFSAQGAKESGLVDSLMYRDSFIKYLEEELGAKGKISCADYIKQTKPVVLHTSDKKKISIIYAEGEIVDLAATGSISESSMRKDIENAQKDSTIAAVVLRVNSPGGSALASDNIWKMLEDLKKDKPIVVSMGDYAASGGYYISCNADYIFAEPTTLTGSIGVFGLMPNIQKLLKKHGITTDGVHTYPNSENPSLLTPINDGMGAVVQKSIEDTYAQFLSRVAAGRDMTVEQVNEIGQGRVWTGSDALEIGLVDGIGGLYDAIDKAAEIAEIEDYEVVQGSKSMSSVESIMEMINGKKDDELIAVFGPDVVKLIDVLSTVSEQKKAKVMARLPYGYQIK